MKKPVLEPGIDSGKSHSPSRSNGSQRKQDGFALVVVLAIIAIMVTLVVYFAMMTQVETQTAAATARHLEARQNALLGLEVAIGQLQKYAGKDQAATFPATTYYPQKDVTTGTGTLYDGDSGEGFPSGFRDFSEQSNLRSYLTRVETYLVPDEREDWENALRDYWNNDEEPRNPHWTGIMDTALRVDRFSNPASPTDLAPQNYENDPDTLHGEPRRDQLPVWLISGNESYHDSGLFDPASDSEYPEGYFTPDSPLPNPDGDADFVWLVGEGSATDESESTDGLDGRVRAPKQELYHAGSDEDEVSGHYAYWVADESIKANFAIRDPYWDAQVNTVEYRNRLQTPQRIGWENIVGFDDGTATFDANDERLAYLNTSAEISLLEDTNVVGVEEAAKRNFHSLTAFSESLLTDTSRGGLKKDLTVFLQGGSVPIGNRAGDPIVNPDNYAPDDPRFRAFGGANAGFPDSTTNVPTWGQIRDWYDNEAVGNGGSLTPSRDVAPVITYISLHSGYSYDPATGEIAVHWIPAIVLWNPWDVALESEGYDIDIGFNIRHWRFHIASPNVNPNDVTLTDSNADGLTDNPNDSGTYWNNRANPDGSDGEPRWFYYAAEEVDNLWTNDDGEGDAHWRTQSMNSTDSEDEIANLGSGTELMYRFDTSKDGTKSNDFTDEDGESLLFDKTFKFRVESSFAPGESRIFTIGSDPDDSITDWEPSERLLLVNDFDADFPAYASYPIMRIKANGPAADDSADDGLSRSIHWRAENLNTSKEEPYVRFALEGSTNPISETNSVGFVQATHIAFAHDESADESPGSWSRTMPRPDRFVDRMVAQETDDAGSAYPAFRVWLQPFTSTTLQPGSPSFDTRLGGNSQDNIDINYAGFSRFNLSRSADVNPLVEKNRSPFAFNNVDALNTTASYYRGGPGADQGGPIAWDEDQYTGTNTVRGFSLVNFQNSPGATLLGLSTLSIRNARRANSEVLSLGQLQQVNLSPFIWQPSFPIGNSEAPVYVDREAIAGINSRPVGENNPNPQPWKLRPNDSDNRMLDISYLLNESLWDRYFLSTIPQQGALDFNEPLPNGRYRFRASLGLSDNDVRDFDEASAYLTNVGALNVNSTSVEAWKALLTAFRDLDIQPQSGSGNPSETVPVSRTLDPILGRIGFHFDGPRVEDDYGNVSSGKDLSKVLSGFRYLDDQMIEALAERIVDEVRLRGPFLSLADFVNRRLVGPQGSNDEDSVWYDARTNGIESDINHNDFMSPDYDPFIGLQGLNGTLQRAINVSGINGGVNHPAMGDAGSSGGDVEDWVYGIRFRNGGNSDNATSVYSGSGIGGSANATSKITLDPSIRHYLDSEHVVGAPIGEAGQLLLGAPGLLTQGDLLGMIGPALTPRGDTFLIRSYGDVVNPVTGETEAQVWCEAVVQRTVEPVDPDPNDEFRPTSRFGRKFEVVKFRWLTPDEI